jgi:hypothetical protein
MEFADRFSRDRLSGQDQNLLVREQDGIVFELGRRLVVGILFEQLVREQEGTIFELGHRLVIAALFEQRPGLAAERQ